MANVRLREISWKDLTLSHEAFLGKGSYGIVIKAKWNKLGVAPIDVAVKIMRRGGGNWVHTESEAEAKLAANAELEAKLAAFAEAKVVRKELICRVLGVAKGKLERALYDKFTEGADCVGIVMQYEDGGSLTNLLHPLYGSFLSPVFFSSRVILRTTLQISQGFIFYFLFFILVAICFNASYSLDIVTT